jgi:4-amino-4-deoxy-L-arabinose transferase-like glycosyltransferase
MPLDSPDCPDTDAFILHSRRLMLLLGIALGTVIATWGHQLGGPVAAIAATLLFSFSPNFLGHAPLVKNDVAITLCAAGLFLAVWRAGRRLTVWNVLAIALLCAAAVTTKFTGLLFGPIVAVMLLGRALANAPWETFWRRLDQRRERVVVAVLVLLIAAGVSYAGIWAAYGFRFGPARDPAVQMDLKQMAVYTAMSEMTVELGHVPSAEEAQLWQPSLATRAAFVMNDMHFLPQPWLYGLLYTYQSALARPSYLMGQYSGTGWWYYFPLAMAFKTPLATLVAAGLALVVLVLFLRRRGWRAAATWSAACLVVPAALFLAAAMRSNLNLGLRHIFPVYALLYLGIGLAAAHAWRTWRRTARVAGVVLALGLIGGTLSAFPDFIAFFNVPSGGARGGLRLLGDSNLDWGQDLKLLAQWQQAHRGERLYLAYFGLADPWSYGIRYTNLHGGYQFGARYEQVSGPGVIAVSATTLQGVYLPDDLRPFYAHLREQERPIDVLGGTIYLYAYPPGRPVGR